MYGPWYSGRRRGQRIDARPQNDPATAAGLRNVHRDMSGKVIGAMTAEGQPIGTKAGKPAGGSKIAERAQIGTKPSALGGGLAKWRGMNPGYDQGKTHAQVAAEGRQQSAESGAFGKSAQRGAKRKALFDRMKKAGAGGLSPGMQKEAADLGVNRSSWRAAVSKLPSAPASIAAPDQPRSGPAQDYVRGPGPWRKPAVAEPQKWRAKLGLHPSVS